MKPNYSKVTFETLRDANVVLPHEREAYIAKVFRQAGVRFPNRKAGWLTKNVGILETLGGLESAKEKLKAALGVSGKIAFLTVFVGVSKKYARNIMMDIYHPEFRRTVAIDLRIQKVSNALKLKLTSYEKEEQFYIGVADATGLEPWELDRLLYNYTQDVIDAL